MMDMLLQDKVLNTIKKYNLLTQGEKVVVGVSGGPDSICLLHALFVISKILDINLFVFHLNHMLRGEEADKDEDYVIGVCKKLEIPLLTKSVNIKRVAQEEGLSIEEAAREIRYREFALYAQAVGASKIAVAHNKNDQAETILMRIIRGTGLDGLTGMELRRGNIIRPLLDISRNEIEEYCNKHLLHPRIDSSNLHNIYTRNKIRLELIPEIDKLFKTDVTDSLVRMSKILRDDNDLLEMNSLDFYKQAVKKEDEKNILINLEKLKTYHISMIKRVIRLAVNKVKQNLKGIESVHLDAAVDLIFDGKTGSRICFPENIFVEKSYNTIKIGQNFEYSSTITFNVEVDIPGHTYIEGLHTFIEASILDRIELGNFFKNPTPNSFLQFFDYEKLDMGINIRNRKSGDIFKPYNSNGTKKLKEYLIDNKIPREKRDIIPIMAKGNEVIWIVGYKISDKFKVTENTKSILKLEYKKEKNTN
jgi:tRNA(Ile)-lysidine synthase